MTRYVRDEVKQAALNLRPARDMQIILSHLREKRDEAYKRAVYGLDEPNFSFDAARGAAKAFDDLLKLLNPET